MQKQKVKGYTRLVYNSKKQKLEKKKTFRVKHSTIALLVLITAIAYLSLQFRGLLSDISPIESVQVPRGINSQLSQESVKEVANLKTSEVSEAYYKFEPKTKYIENELQVFQAVIEACNHHGLDNDQCRNDLMGMVYAETRTFENKLGDNSLSRGILQIHKGYHPDITKEQAEDIYFASKWTLARMINYGYKTDRERAIMKHNGTPYTKATLNYLNTVNYYINL